MLIFQQTPERKENQKIDKYFGHTRELKNAVENETDGDINCRYCPWNGPQESKKETGETEDQRKNQNHPHHSTLKLS